MEKHTNKGVSRCNSALLTPLANKKCVHVYVCMCACVHAYWHSCIAFAWYFINFRAFSYPLHYFVS